MKRLYPWTFLSLAVLFAFTPALVRPLPKPSSLPQYTIVPIRDTPLPHYEEATPYGINDQGEVLCTAEKMPEMLTTSYLWKHGGMKLVGLLPTALNDQNKVIGSTLTHRQVVNADGVIWQDGKITRVPSKHKIFLNAINQKGQVVGSLYGGDGHLHAILWANGRLKNLGVLPGCQASVAFAINDSGEIVGECIAFHKASGGREREFHYPCLYVNGKWQRIGHLCAYSFRNKKYLLGFKGVDGGGYAINDKGDVVIHWDGFAAAGKSEHQSEQTYLWSAGRVAYIAGFWEVDAITDDDLIIGDGTLNQNGLPHPLIWKTDRRSTWRLFCPLIPVGSWKTREQSIATAISPATANSKASTAGS